jgi:protease secretion system membrane fusion protein
MFTRLRKILASKFLSGWRQATFDDQADTTMTDTNIPPLKTDASPVIRFGILALVIGFGGSVLWAALAPLDEGVPTMGVVTVESKRKAIQHLRGGIVQEINVQEGTPVKAGDVLVRLNDSEARSQLDIALAQYWTTMAVETRLLAELEQKHRIEFPEALREAAHEPRAAEAMRVQEILFRTRHDALNSEISILQENMKGLQEQIKGLQSLQAGKQKQIDLISEELKSMRDLAKEGFIPQVKLMELERALADLSGTRGEDMANIARAQNAIAEVKFRTIQRTQEFQKEVQSHLTDVQKDSANLRDRVKALTEEVERDVMRAPVDGTVVGLDVHTIGGVIQPGQRIMDVVPHGEALVIEVQIPTNLIEKVQTGLEADIRFSTVKSSLMPPIEGRLMTVSADRLVDSKSGLPYYLGRVEVTTKGLHDLHKANHSIQPGMQADVVIKTGERTLLIYLLKPLINRVSGSMKEI